MPFLCFSISLSRSRCFLFISDSRLYSFDIFALALIPSSLSNNVCYHSHESVIMNTCTNSTTVCLRVQYGTGNIHGGSVLIAKSITTVRLQNFPLRWVLPSDSSKYFRRWLENSLVQGFIGKQRFPSPVSFLTYKQKRFQFDSTLPMLWKTYRCRMGLSTFFLPELYSLCSCVSTKCRRPLSPGTKVLQYSKSRSGSGRNSWPCRRWAKLLLDAFGSIPSFLVTDFRL
jgi:hypothetical protein